jgi:hypothetical protein
MEKLLKSASAAALLLALLVPAACRQIENPGKIYPQSPTVEDTRSKTISRNLPEDIPVPRDMTYVTRLNQSFGYSEGGVRLGRYHLWGNVPGDEVAAFYRETMPQRPYGWTLVNEQSHGATNVLHFRKDSDRVDISIGPEQSSTIAEISLNAEARNP